MMGQTTVPDKGNELTACQTDIAQTIAEGNGWYLLAVKDNKSDLHAHLQRDFAYLDPPVPWPMTAARPRSGGTDASSGAPARSWAAPAASGTNSIRTAAGRT